MNISRTPLFFGPEDRSLFGWYHAPAEAGDLAIVVCPPLGHEGINAHRGVRHLADALARAGMPALRFDYHGTGDSAGRDEDPGRVAAWQDSIVAAMAALRGLSGCARIGLLGVRLGATLAASVAAAHEVDALLLWFPAVRGRAWVREMKALHLTGVTHDAPSAPGVLEAGGFTVTAETQRDVSALDLEALVPKARRVLLITRDDLSADASLRERWSAAGLDVEQRAVPGFAGMFLAPHAAAAPERAIEESVLWLGKNAGRGFSPPLPGVRTSQVTPQIVERTILFGRGQRMFGILSEPAGAGARSLPAIVLSNAGATHHAGPNRLYVILARALSAAGFRCLRFDLPGLGDSIADDPARENDPYPPDASAFLGEAAALFAEGDGQAVVLMGLCSGAHASFHAAVDLPDFPIVESVIVNPLTFYYQPGMPLDAPLARHHEEWQRYTARSIWSLRSWKRLLRGEVRIAAVAHNVFSRFRDIAASRFRSRHAPLHDLARDLRHIAASGRRLTFVFSRLDPGYDLLMIAAGPEVRRWKKRGLIDLWRIEGATHTFEAAHARGVMVESVVRHLVRRYGSGGGLAEQLVAG